MSGYESCLEREIDYLKSEMDRLELRLSDALDDKETLAVELDRVNDTLVDTTFELDAVKGLVSKLLMGDDKAINTVAVVIGNQLKVIPMANLSYHHEGGKVTISGYDILGGYDD